MKWIEVPRILNENNVLQPNPNNPKLSGEYVCTCVKHVGEELYYYMRVMAFDVEKQYWHDIGNPSSISHCIIAYAEDMPLCTSTNFIYKAGEAYIEK